MRMLKQLALIGSFGLMFGCGKSAPQPLTDANFSSELNKSFASAKAEPKEMIQQATASFENKQFVAANSTISTLLSRQDLSAQERTAASQALINLNQKIAEAAAQGDPVAQQMQRMKAAGK
jgi:hypothetical protein